MKLIKKLFLGAAMALSLASVQASPINIDGVVWDPDAELDFSSASLAIRQVIAGDGSLSGFGVINSFNGTTAFCQGCQLTFTFSGYTPIGILSSIPGITSFGYIGGSVKVYVNHDVNTFVNEANSSNYTASMFNLAGQDLFLELAGHPTGTTTFIGTVIGTSQISQLLGSGTLDVIGGDAKSNFDTNTKEGGSDLSFSSSFTRIRSLNDASGTGNFDGNTIPEPASLALAGLALLGAGIARRRKA